MSVFILHDTRDFSVSRLIAMAIGGRGPTAEDVSATRCPGPAIMDRETEWWVWELRDGAAPIEVPSSLDEGDEDDVPYPSRWGVFARADGTATTYLATARADGPETTRELLASVMEAAGSDYFVPRPDPARPIPGEMLQLRAGLAAVLPEGGEALASYSWVRITSKDREPVFVEPAAEGIQLSYVTIVQAGEDGPADPEDADALTARDFGQVLGELGFVRDSAEASSGDADDYCVNWIAIAPDIETAAQLAGRLWQLENPVRRAAP